LPDGAGLEIIQLIACEARVCSLPSLLGLTAFGRELN
jgi:hypothetical protein